MLFDYETLKLIWWILVGALLIGFAITDGMDMGAAILLPFVAKTDDERRVVINTVGAHWDGNQVWLITAGGALFAAWPMVYAAAFSGFYFALILVLFALFLRPLGFDYRSKLDNAKWRNGWDWALFVGSFVPALVFGVAFGNLLQGVPFTLDEFLRATYTGSFFALLNPFAILAGLVSVAMLVMHGGVWLQLRTDGIVSQRAAVLSRWASVATFVLFCLAGIWVANLEGFVITTAVDTQGYANPLGKSVELVDGAWLSNYKEMPLTILCPLLALAATAATAWFSKGNKAGLGFVASSVALLGVIATAGVSMFPFVMPSSINPDVSLTLWDAVSSHMTLNVMLIAVLIFLPIVLFYTVWCYVKMWRKVSVAEIQGNTHGTY